MLVKINDNKWINPEIVESIHIEEIDNKYYIIIHYSILNNKYGTFGPFVSLQEASDRMQQLINNINRE